MKIKPNKALVGDRVSIGESDETSRPRDKQHRRMATALHRPGRHDARSQFDLPRSKSTKHHLPALTEAYAKKPRNR
jgi:hypothetical protein